MIYKYKPICYAAYCSMSPENPSGDGLGLLATWATVPPMSPLQAETHHNKMLWLSLFINLQIA